MFLYEITVEIQNSDNINLISIDFETLHFPKIRQLNLIFQESSHHT